MVVWLPVWRRCVVVGCVVRRANAVWIASTAVAKQVPRAVERHEWRVGDAYTRSIFPTRLHARYPGHGFTRKGWGMELAVGC